MRSLEYHHAVARLATNPWSSDTSDSILSMTQPLLEY
jgi:hypothetical protein